MDILIFSSKIATALNKFRCYWQEQRKLQDNSKQQRVCLIPEKNQMNSSLNSLRTN